MTERTTGRLLTVLAMAMLAALIALCAYIKPAETLPGGFSDVKVTDAHFPTALAFTPDGRMVVAGKSGQVYLYDRSGNNLAKPQAMTLPVCDNSERGLLGVAVHPEFGTAGNNYVYFYYTHRRSVCPDKQPADPRNPYNRVSRFQMNGDTIDRTSEKVLVDGIPSPNGNHNAGDLHFGNDGKLYVSVGDGACDYAEKTKCQYENDAARDENVLLGKILRLNPDGTIPADNPFTGTNSARCSNESGGIARAAEGQRCQETFVSGFRNPFRFAVDPDAEGTRLFINDVGGQRWEEVDEAVFGANSGDDYGWNVCEGRHDNPYRAGQENCAGATKTAPIHEYNHSTGCESVTAGAFVPDDARWPDGYRDAYLYGDFVCGRIFSLKPQDGGYARTTFADGLGLRSAVAMDFGPYKSTRKALYYATFEDGGMIRRISYEAGNQDPIARLETDDGKNYSPDLTMIFDASGSTDAEGQALSYEWDFGDGEKQTTTTPKVTHEYGPRLGQAARGEYQVSVTVKDDTTGVSDPPARLTVYPGDTPPNRPSITSPADESTFTVPPKDGEAARANITATGSATDPDGDTVTLEWEVVQHHDANHAHPYANGTGDSFMFPGAEPEGLYSTDPQGNYLEVRLTARDSLGLASEPTTIELRPETVELRFVPNPLDLKLKIAGKVFRGPQTLTSWVGQDLNVGAPRQRDREGRTWAFKAWSDGGPATHTIVAPEDAKTYTATFRKVSR